MPSGNSGKRNSTLSAAIIKSQASAISNPPPIVSPFSAAITGLAGVLLAHHLTYLSPEVFGVLESLKLMLMIVVGGLGYILGAIFGAILISLLPVSISFLKDVLPPVIGQQAGLEPLLFGLIIVLFIVFEPQGIYGRWMKLRFFFETFPYYRKSSFVRQKSYLKTERMR